MARGRSSWGFWKSSVFRVVVEYSGRDVMLLLLLHCHKKLYNIKPKGTHIAIYFIRVCPKLWGEKASKKYHLASKKYNVWAKLGKFLVAKTKLSTQPERSSYFSPFLHLVSLPTRKLERFLAHGQNRVVVRREKLAQEKVLFMGKK